MNVFSKEQVKELLFNSLKDDLDWLFNEFDELYTSKYNKLTSQDSRIANDILDYVNNQFEYTTIEEYNLFTKKINQLEQVYKKLLYENESK